MSESAICCFVFSFWIRADQENRDGWTPAMGSSLCVSPSTSWSCRTAQPLTANCVHSLVCSRCTEKQNEPKNNPMHALVICLWESYWLASLTQPPPEAPFHTLYTYRRSLSWGFIDPNRHSLQCPGWDVRIDGMQTFITWYGVCN